MMGFTLLQAMTSLEQNFASVTTPYLMILPPSLCPPTPLISPTRPPEKFRPSH